jgi:hypothetical protein
VICGIIKLQKERGNKMLSYTAQIRNKLIGKTIKEVYLDGFGIVLAFTDGTEFTFDASDGGYSQYEFIEKEGE